MRARAAPPAADARELHTTSAPSSTHAMRTRAHLGFARRGEQADALVGRRGPALPGAIDEPPVAGALIKGDAHASGERGAGKEDAAHGT